MFDQPPAFTKVLTTAYEEYPIRYWSFFQINTIHIFRISKRISVLEITPSKYSYHPEQPSSLRALSITSGAERPHLDFCFYLSVFYNAAKSKSSLCGSCNPQIHQTQSKSWAYALRYIAFATLIPISQTFRTELHDDITLFDYNYNASLSPHCSFKWIITLSSTQTLYKSHVFVTKSNIPNPWLGNSICRSTVCHLK